MDLIWGRGVAATDAWVGSLSGAVIARDTLRVTDLIVARGLVFPRRFAVPLDRVTRLDGEGIFLDIPITGVLGLTTWSPEDGDASKLAFTPRTRFPLADSARLRIKGLRTANQERLVSHLLVSKPGPFSPSRLLPVSLTTELGRGEITADTGAVDWENLTAYRLDGDIERSLMEALFDSANIAETDLKGITVRSGDGMVSLIGNVRSSSAAVEAERLALSVDGGTGVENQLVTDWQIELAVANLVTAQRIESPDSIVTHAQLGTVILEGRIPSQEAKVALIQAVQAVSGVRLVEDLLDVRPTAEVAGADSATPTDRESGTDATPEGTS